MGLPIIYVDICAHGHTTCSTSLLSFIGGIVGNLDVEGCPFFDLCPVMIPQFHRRSHSLTRPLAPGLISEAVTAGSVDIFAGFEKCEPTFNLNALISVPTGYVRRDTYSNCCECESSDLWAILATDQ